MKDRRREEPADEDEEALLSDSEKGFEQKYTGRQGWPTAVSFSLTACFALIGGVLLGRYLFLDKNSVCTAHVSQNSMFLLLRQLGSADIDDSAASRSNRSFVQGSQIQRVVSQRKHLPTASRSGSGRGVGSAWSEL